MNYFINLLFFIIYTILHFSILSKLINYIANGKNISVGIFFIIAGIWGYCINNLFFKIFTKKPRLVNVLIIIFGFILVGYALFFD
jgi:H+/Cl- antiporter ClcA